MRNQRKALDATNWKFSRNPSHGLPISRHISWASVEQPAVREIQNEKLLSITSNLMIVER
jgi:hypothetical protein